MAGIWPQSFSQVNDLNGKPIVGAKAFFYAGGTTTPISTFRNYDMTTPHTNPLSTDGWGRFPAVYVADDVLFYRVRLTTSAGVLLYDVDQIPVIGPITPSGDSPVAPVDPDGVAKTGDVKARYGTGFNEGWVRCNGRTIGSATSGASERSAVDCQPLFEHLWNNDSSLEVLGGRGANAASDWSANKPITLPDFRGRTLIGLDGMGNTAANVIPEATQVGWKGGKGQHILTTTEMPSHSHDGSAKPAGGHSHLIEAAGGSGDRIVASGPGILYGPKPTSSEPPHTHELMISATGGGAAHNNIQPSAGITIYIRL